MTSKKARDEGENMRTKALSLNLAATQSNVKTLREWIEGLEVSLARLQEWIEGLEDNLTRAASDAASHAGRVEDLANSIEDIEARLASAFDRIDELEK